MLQYASGKKRPMVDSPGAIYQRLNATYRAAGMAPEARAESGTPPRDDRPRFDTAAEIYARMNRIYSEWGKREGVR